MIRRVLLVGFGLTFAIWLLVGSYFSRRLSDVEARAAAINARYVQAQELLSGVRAQVLLGSVYVRDALLDPDPATAPGYRRRIEETYQSVDRTLQEYVPVLDSAAEGERVSTLRKEVHEFQDTMLRVLASDSGRWPTDARTLLSAEIVPKREVVISVSEQVQALNRSAFVREQASVASVYGATQRRVWAGLGLALVASFGIGWAATAYAARLEEKLRRQRRRDARNTSELQRLSAKLITAQEEERRTFARELHDEVGQVLTAMKAELAVAQRAIDHAGGPPRVLDDVRSIADAALISVRDLSHLLHPSLLDDLGLSAAMEWYIRGFSKRHDLRVEVLNDLRDERFSPEIEAAIYRIVQEALTNVVKHARAASIRVVLQRFPTTVLVTVEDDGVGFDAKQVQRIGERRGLGLIGARERVATVGGGLRIESTPGGGTRLTIELPVRPAGAGPDAAVEPASPAATRVAAAESVRA